MKKKKKTIKIFSTSMNDRILTTDYIWLRVIRRVRKKFYLIFRSLICVIRDWVGSPKPRVRVKRVRRGNDWMRPVRWVGQRRSQRSRLFYYPRVSGTGGDYETKVGFLHVRWCSRFREPLIRGSGFGGKTKKVMWFCKMDLFYIILSLLIHG